jgi:hypothetical protein
MIHFFLDLGLDFFIGFKGYNPIEDTLDIIIAFGKIRDFNRGRIKFNNSIENGAKNKFELDSG